MPTSIVRNIAATEAAFWRAERVTFFGSMTPVECICSASSFSAGGYPIPLRVATCTITGRL